MLFKKGRLDSQLLKLGKPSNLLLTNGFIDAEMQMDYGILQKATNEKHWLRIEDFINLPHNINEPVAIFKSTKGNKSKVIVTVVRDYLKRRIVVVIRIDTISNKQILTIPSVYGKDTVRQILSWEKNGLLIWKDEKKWVELFR